MLYHRRLTSRVVELICSKNLGSEINVKIEEVRSHANGTRMSLRDGKYESGCYHTRVSQFLSPSDSKVIGGTRECAHSNRLVALSFFGGAIQQRQAPVSYMQI